ncbi:hypothetical protein [Nesterenkonia muleiensis]|uniref:hypothetical protein n=1 Tax=Nesterenkonia muleiensis TaxID=2282648 RepID=UPI000E72689F|nr:hypothetical protein [Nesterenkonia muleiensis]
MSILRFTTSCAALSVAALVATACGGEDPAAGAPDHASAASAADLEVPAPEATVTTPTPAMVMDDDGTAELCLGAVAESYPPQCGGPELIGWDWEEQDSGSYEEEQGTRWGEYAVVGDYDPQEGTFELESAVPAGEWDGEPPEQQMSFSTPCEEPEGGWEILDQELVSEQRMYDTFERAEELEGYAGSWVDQSLNPVQPEDLNDDEDMGDQEHQELAASLNDPEYVIINVRVSADPETAYGTLREEWGGMLCVTEAQYQQAELEQIQQEIMEIDGALSAGVEATTNQLTVEVTYDDGSLESQLHEIYGEGTLRLSSRLVPAEDQ